jgi:hypothetical protein
MHVRQEVELVQVAHLGGHSVVKIFLISFDCKD